MSGSPIPRLITSIPASRLSATRRSSSANMYGGIASRRFEGSVRAMGSPDCPSGPARDGCALRVAQRGGEARNELAREDRLGGADQAQVELVADLDLELAAVEHDRDRARRAARGRRRPRHRWRRCPRRASPPPRARRSAPGPASPRPGMNETLVRFGNSSRSLDRRADRAAGRAPRARRRPRSRTVGCRRDVLKRPVRPADVERRRGRRPAARDSRARSPTRDRSPSRPSPGPVIVGVTSPALVMIVNVVLVGPARLAQVEDRLAGAVAGELGLGTVGVEDPQLGDVALVVARREQQDAVGADPEVRIADPRGSAPRSAPTGARRPRR